MPKPRTVRAFSAGGVVFRRSIEPLSDDALVAAQRPEASGGAARAEIVLVGRAWENFWVLPKGTPQTGESVAEVALREVAEETGITATIIAELGSVHYWFSRQNVRFNKEVFYYLMEATGGDVTLHDHEYDDARWFLLGDAIQRLTYANEAELARLAEPLIGRFLEEHPG